MLHPFNEWKMSTPSMAGFALGVALFAVTGVALGEDPTPPADNPGGRHHNPAWAECKKQADDQKLEAGDARKQFMRNCLKAAKSAAPTPS